MKYDGGALLKRRKPIRKTDTSAVLTIRLSAEELETLKDWFDREEYIQAKSWPHMLSVFVRKALKTIPI